MSLLKVPTPALLFLEYTLNRQMRRDASVRSRWQTLVDHRVFFSLRDPNLSIVFCVTPQGVLLLREIEGVPSATIYASSFGLLRARHAASPLDALFSGDVQIEGDQAIAESLLRLLVGLDFDFFAELAEKLGAAPSGWFENRWRNRQTEREIWRDTRALELKDFLVYEQAVLPMESSLLTWSDAVDGVRDRTDRLIARLACLETQPATPGAS